MSRHNYTNPAFCQKSEFFENPNKNQVTTVGGVHIQRSESTRSFHTTRKNSRINNQQTIQFSELPPKPGPKPQFQCSEQFEHRTGSGRYALVPVEELSTSYNGRYAVIPGPDTEIIQRFSKSQDNIDRYTTAPSKEKVPSFPDELEDTFTSLPPIPMHDESRLKSAFSSDFGSKSFVLVDQKSNQRYAVVPTAENEEIVDENHEIIQMHNGRKHRYAIIPTDEEETCLSHSDLGKNNHNYAIIHDSPKRPLQTSTPQKRTPQGSQPVTPIKNSLATQKLHEILSTPRKPSIQRQNSTVRNSARRYQSQQIFVNATKQEFTPQRLQYDTKQAYLEARTTAVITPRVANSCPNDDNDTSNMNKTWNNTSFQKVANATATIGAVSLMLILCGAMNSGLCLYMISNIGRSYYLDIGVVSGFAGVALGILGYKSRHCDWLPNRNYISGFILVTVFSLLKCCGLLVLLTMQPFPGTPLHDVTTGVVLGLSSLTLLLISLGVITSRWCRAPPPDNRVDVY